MKIKENYIAKHVLDNDVVIDITGSSKNILKLNPTASLMFEKLKEGISTEDLVKVILDNYDIDPTTAINDVNKFIEELNKLNVLEND